MIWVVLDTNIIVSALLQPLGPSAQILILALGGVLKLCVSGEIYVEYEEVISRPRFARDPAVIAATLQSIRERAIWVELSSRLKVCADPDDDIFLECAEEARASYLVTGNVRHFPPSWKDTAVITPRRMLDILEAGMETKAI